MQQVQNCTHSVCPWTLRHCARPGVGAEPGKHMLVSQRQCLLAAFHRFWRNHAQRRTGNQIRLCLKTEEFIRSDRSFKVKIFFRPGGGGAHL